MFLSFRCILVFLVFSFSISVIAQDSLDFVPFENLDDYADNLKADLKSYHSIDHNRIHDWDYSKEIKEYYDRRYNSLIEDIDEEVYLYDEQLYAMLDRILETVKAGNPNLDTERVRIIVSKQPWPNAYCHGQGTISINIGLLRRLESEDQLAFIICHELAHYYENHVNNSIHKRVRTVNSKDFKKKVKAIKRSDYQQNRQFDALVQDIVFDSRKHGREHESDADSIGAAYLANTNYNMEAAKEVLAILDSIDREKYDLSIDYEKTFHSDEYPFKSYWLGDSETLISMGGDDFAWDEDSLKTHPACQLRLASISRQYPEANPYNKTENNYFKTLVSHCDFEFIESYFYYGRYDKTLYYSLRLLNIYPKSAYLHTKVSQSLHLMYQAQKNHELNKFVDLPSNDQEKDFKKLLEFIHSLRLSELAQINYVFASQHLEKFGINEDYFYYFIMASKNMKMEGDVILLKEQYLKHFPEGKYTAELNNL